MYLIIISLFEMLIITSLKMAVANKHMVNSSKIISNFARYDNPTKCETCKDLEMQLYHALNELSLVRLNL